MTRQPTSFGVVIGSDGLAGQAPPETAVGSLVSVLVPCCGQLEYTRLCLPALLRHTPPPYELLFLDIGSFDGTAEYLAGAAAAASVPVEVVRAPTDLELPEAVQEMLRRARGDFLVLLNNDTVVPHGWLDQLVALASMSAGIGMVGPMSSYASPPQLVEAVPYRLRLSSRGGPLSGPSREQVLADMEVVDRFARGFCAQHQGQWRGVERLAGFCVLLKREVLAQVGPLQAQSGLDLFDVGALCRQVRQADYTLAVCRDLFVHHFGSHTFAHGAPATADDGRQEDPAGG